MFKKVSLIFMIVFMMASTCFASKIGVVILGDAEFREDTVIDAAVNAINNDAGVTNVSVGKDEQLKYLRYWCSKGLMDTPEITPAVLVEYVNASGYDKIMYLVVNNNKLDAQNLWGTRMRTTVDLIGYVVDRSRIVTVYNSINAGDSTYSEVRARRDAMSKSCKRIFTEAKVALK